jgi:hypothetical protein
VFHNGSQLLSKILYHAHPGSDFALDKDLFYPSFVRVTEIEAPISAADVVYSLHGLLAAGGAASAHLYTVEYALDRQVGEHSFVGLRLEVSGGALMRYYGELLSGVALLSATNAVCLFQPCLCFVGIWGVI